MRVCVHARARVCVCARARVCLMSLIFRWDLGVQLFLTLCGIGDRCSRSHSLAVRPAESDLSCRKHTKQVKGQSMSRCPWLSDDNNNNNNNNKPTLKLNIIHCHFYLLDTVQRGGGIHANVSDSYNFPTLRLSKLDGDPLKGPPLTDLETVTGHMASSIRLTHFTVCK